MNDVEYEFVFFFNYVYFFAAQISENCALFRNHGSSRKSRFLPCDTFRSHFEKTSSTFELLAWLLTPSEHIPKGNAFGKRPIQARKQIAVTVWALANQETCRQISDCFDVTISSVSLCIGRVVRALVDLCTDLIQWPRGIIVILVFTLRTKP